VRSAAHSGAVVSARAQLAAQARVDSRRQRALALANPHVFLRRARGGKLVSQSSERRDCSVDCCRQRLLGS